MRAQDVFKELPTLQTERLTLRKLEPGDLKDLFSYGCDASVTRFTTWEAYQSVGDAKEFLANVIARYESRREAPWGIALQDDNKLIGTCGFDDWSIRNARAEVSYALGKAHWGKGYMTEALKRVVNFGFDTMELNRIDARCVPENAASRRVMEKIGMTFEGVLRQHMHIRGEYRDVQLYSILRSEWEKQPLV